MRRLAAPGSVHAPQVSAPSAAAHARQAAPRPARTGRRRRAQVACLSAAPLAGGAPAAELLAVGTWDRCLHLLRLPGLAPATPKEALGGDVIPRRWAREPREGSLRGCRYAGGAPHRPRSPWAALWRYGPSHIMYIAADG